MNTSAHPPSSWAQKSIFVLIIGLILIPFVMGLYQTSRAIGTYWLTFSLRGRLVHETETNKLLESGYPSVRLHAALAVLANPDDVVLNFRLAEAGFYGKRPFIYFIDPRLIPLYQAKTIDAGWKALEKNKIRFILVPPYAMPEIYGTIVQHVLASPEHVSLLYDLEGWRLFRVHDTVRPPLPLPKIVAENFTTHPKAASNWHMTEDTLTDPKGLPYLDTSTGWLHIRPTLWRSSDHTPRLRLFRDEVFYSGVPGILRRTLALTPASINRFEARVIGKGLVRVYLDYGDDRRRHFNAWSRTLIWEGILNGSPQQIMNQFMVPAEYPAPDPNNSSAAASRLTFETVGETALALQSWDISQVSSHTPLLDAPYEPRKRWLVVRSRYSYSFEPPLASQQFTSEKADVHVTNYGSYATELYGPFHLATATKKNLVRISGLFSGTGIIRVSLLYGCSGAEEPTYMHIGEILLTKQAEEKKIVAGVPCPMAWVQPILRLYTGSVSLRPKGANTTLKMDDFRLEGGSAHAPTPESTAYSWQDLPMSQQPYFRFVKEPEKPRFP
jgi:hypothetical protein